MKKTILCGNCNKAFVGYDAPSRPNRTKYCSISCQRKGRPKDKFWLIATKEQKLERLKKVFFKKVIINENNCWDWSGKIGKDGYIRIKTGLKSIKAHRLSWIIYNGNLLDKICVLHKCDNRKCTNPNHLFLGNRADNIHDMVKKNRNKSFPGESNGRAKISEEIARKIIELLKNNISKKQIAIELNIPSYIVYSIAYGQTWKHLIP